VIIDLPDTKTSAINRALVDLRDSGGAVALGRVLTLVIVTEELGAEQAIAASREHPCRVIVVVQANRRGIDRLDGQIRVGGDAGASEVIVLRLYGELANHGDSVVTPLLLPDSPVVAWWPGAAPSDPARSPLGAMAHRRITDAAAAENPQADLGQRGISYAVGDTDLSWTRITRWRGLLAAALDQPPHHWVDRVTVTGASDSPSTDLLAGWLARSLNCPVTREQTSPGTGMGGVRLERSNGVVELKRSNGTVATLTQPGQPDRRISLPRRDLAECLSEELRRLDPDEIYHETLTEGLGRVVSAAAVAAAESERAGHTTAGHTTAGHTTAGHTTAGHTTVEQPA
jgi:glucose-6-phosphate dehydrogenase assembly protein OpcA